MKISRKAIELIKHYESLAMVGDDGLIYPYLDPVGIPTIGWGNISYHDGKRVTMQDEPITKYQAEGLLIDTIEKVSDDVNKILEVQLEQNEFDALISFTYNLGIGNLKKSTLLERINMGQSKKLVMAEFMKWVYAGGKKLPGLVKRRNSEAILYGYNKLDFITK